MQKGPQETIKLPPGAQKILAHLAFFLMWDHCALDIMLLVLLSALAGGKKATY